MLVGKKISKIRKEPTTDKLTKRKRNKKFCIRCCFESLPYSPKYIYPYDFYLFHGDITLSTAGGKLQFEFSLLNNFKVIQNIAIENTSSEIVHISLAKNTSLHIPHWSYEIDKLGESEETKISGWATKLRDYCNRFEEMMRNYEELKSTYNQEKIEQLKEIDRCSKLKRKELLEKVPTLICKKRHKDHNLEFNEVIINDKFYKQMGYHKDSLVSTILEEGLPQLSTFDNNCGLEFIELGVDNTFSVDKEGFTSDVYDSNLIMKSGYIKKIKAQLHRLMTYEDGDICFETIITINSQDEPVFNKALINSNDINPKFLSKMIQQEKDLDYLLSNYYEESFPLRYTNYDKICGIRELQE